MYPSRYVFWKWKWFPNLGLVDKFIHTFSPIAIIWNPKNGHARQDKHDVPFTSGQCWTNFCSQKLKRRTTFGNIWFQQDGATSHTARCFGPWFWRLQYQPQPPRNCDLTALDYYLWGAVKNKCYVDKPEIIDVVKDNIREAIGEIHLHTINNVLKNWTDRIGYCMASRGSHLNENIFLY